jgi:hypothetical protein
MSLSSSKASSVHKGDAASVGSDKVPIPRGVFAHRRGEAVADERKVVEFWLSCGITAESMEDANERFSSMPDLQLSRDGIPWACCEVKTIWRHRWTVRILHEGRTAEERVEESKASASERISADLITALRQLKAGNPTHALLNIVVLVNRDAEASLGLLSRVLAPAPKITGRTLPAKRAAMLANEMQEFRRCVDMCLWTVEQADGQLAVEGCLLFAAALQEQIANLPGLGFGKQIILDPAA